MGAAAKHHYERGLALYAERAFDAAVREFQQGYAIEPRREFLFAEAQAQRLAGRCDRALPLYERFLASGPSPVQTEAALMAVDRCVRATPAGAAPAPAPAGAASPALGVGPGVAASSAQPRIARPREGGAGGMGRPKDAQTPAGGEEREVSAHMPAPAPLWRDPWLLASGTVGLAASVIGATALVSAQSREQAAADATTYAEFDRLWTSADRRRTIGLAALVVAAAATGAGLFRALGRHADRERGPASLQSARAGWNLLGFAIEGWIAW